MREVDLLALVEQERFDEVYEAVDVDDVADAWLAYHREPMEEGAPLVGGPAPVRRPRRDEAS